MPEHEASGAEGSGGRRVWRYNSWCRAYGTLVAAVKRRTAWMEPGMAVVSQKEIGEATCIKCKLGKRVTKDLLQFWWNYYWQLCAPGHMAQDCPHNKPVLILWVVDKTHWSFGSHSFIPHRCHCWHCPHTMLSAATIASLALDDKVFLVKLGIQSAQCLLSAHPKDHSWLGMHWSKTSL